jgi:hypothetical protein
VIDIILPVIEEKAESAMEESKIVVRDFLCKYPNNFQEIIGLIYSKAEIINDWTSKGSLIWIFGEYCSIIE